jgi:outer membrane protein TolC
MITRKFNVAILILSCTITGTSLQAQSVAKHEFSVQQCVEYARKNNAQVKNALITVQIQEQTNRGVTSAALPSVTGSLNATSYIDIPTTLVPAQFFGGAAGTYEAVQFGTKYTGSASMQLQQTLFDGQVFIGLKARSVAMDYQRKAADVTEEGIRVNVYKIYYQLVVSKVQIDILDANISRLGKLKHDASEMYKNGFAEKLDVDKLDVQIANLETQKKQALNSIDIGYLGLKTLLGMPVKDSLILTDKITEDEIKNDVLTDTTALDYAKRNEYQYLQILKKLDEFNIKRYQLSYLPVLSLTGSYSKQAQRSKFDFFSKGDWFTTSYIGLNMSIPIFDGFNKDSKIKQSRFELQQTVNNIDNLKLSIDNDVEQARLKFANAIGTMDYQKKNMSLAENVYSQTQKKFQAGVGSNTEIAAAQTDLIAAQTNYINAMYDAIIARIDYLKATGTLK